MTARAAVLPGQCWAKMRRGPRVSPTRSFGAPFRWEALFSEVAEFATELGGDRMISISHSEDKDEGVVTVWFWK